MHVTIEREHGAFATGLFGIIKKKAFALKVTIVFTNEELHAIEQAKLSSYILISRPFHPCYTLPPQTFEEVEANYLKVGALVRSHNKNEPVYAFYADTQPEVDKADSELRDKLKALKSQIEKALKPSPSRDSFEL
jgi:hypothetical protein